MITGRRRVCVRKSCADVYEPMISGGAVMNVTVSKRTINHASGKAMTSSLQKPSYTLINVMAGSGQCDGKTQSHICSDIADS